MQYSKTIIDLKEKQRYLNRWNTTIIAEYYRNDFGWTKNDYSNILI